MVTLKDRPNIRLRDNWLELLAHELGAGRKIKRIRTHRRSYFNRTIIVFFEYGKSRFVKASLIMDVATIPPYEVVQLGETLASLAQNQVSQVQSLVKLGKSEASAIAEVAGFRWDGQEDDRTAEEIEDFPAVWPSEQAWQKRGCPAVPFWAWKGAIVNLRGFNPGLIPAQGEWFQIPVDYNNVIAARSIELAAFYGTEGYITEFVDQYEEMGFNGEAALLHGMHTWADARYNLNHAEGWKELVESGILETERMAAIQVEIEGILSKVEFDRLIDLLQAPGEFYLAPWLNDLFEIVKSRQAAIEWADESPVEARAGLVDSIQSLRLTPQIKGKLAAFEADREAFTSEHHSNADGLEYFAPKKAKTKAAKPQGFGRK